MAKLKIGAIASGSGIEFLKLSSNLPKRYTQMTKRKFEILICNKAGAYCMERAKNHRIQAC